MQIGGGGRYCNLPAVAVSCTVAAREGESTDDRVLRASGPSNVTHRSAYRICLRLIFKIVEKKKDDNSVLVAI